MNHRLKEFFREHKWEIILGLVFAVLFGVVWELAKHTHEQISRVSPDRLGAGTVRVMTAIRLRNDAQRKVMAEWVKDHPSAIAEKDFAILRWGSGFAVSDDGWIVTAHHVVNMKSPKLAPLLAKIGEKPFLVVLYPPREERAATLVDRDAVHDTAILKVVNAPPNTFLVLGETEERHRLERVFAAGYPGAADFSSPFEPTITAGEITKAGVQEPFGQIFQITAPIGPGNSGGPLLDAGGRAIGINVGTPAGRDMAIAFAMSIEHAAKMLEKRGVELPTSYETQGVLRQPLVVWTTIVAAAALFFAYFGVSLRSFWRRRFKTEADPPYAGFWIRFLAFVLDVAIVIPIWLLLIVLLIVAADSFMPWYAFVIGVLPAWWLYAAFCEWRWGATIGKKVAGLNVRRAEGGQLSFGGSLLRSAAHFVSAVPLALGFLAAAFEPRRRAWHDRIADTVVVETKRRSPWGMLLLGTFAFALMLVCVFVHWGILIDRAIGDLEKVHVQSWKPARKTDASLIARAMDRGTFLQWAPPMGPHEDVMYGNGLDLMLLGRPHDALRALGSAAGAPWELFAGGTGIGYSSIQWSAATKAGWCYFDAGEVRRARQFFERVESDSNLDAALGLAVTSFWQRDLASARAACAKAKTIDAKAVERLRGSPPHLPVPRPFYLTPSQLRAVQQTFAACDAPVTR